MNEKRLPFVVICNSQHAQNSGLVLVKSDDVSEKKLLESMAQLDQVSPLTFTEALIALIARKVLRFNIPLKSETIYALSGLLMRTVKTYDLYDGTLLSLYKKIMEYMDVRKRIEISIALGDIAIHNVAGRRIPKFIKKQWGIGNFQAYAKEMALTGYTYALEMALRAGISNLTRSYVC